MGSRGGRWNAENSQSDGIAANHSRMHLNEVSSVGIKTAAPVALQQGSSAVGDSMRSEGMNDSLHT